MFPIPALAFTGRLAPGRMLDVGSRDFFIASRIVEEGFTVDAIDPEPADVEQVPQGVSFIQTTLEDFRPEESYDLVVARLVSHLVTYSTRDFLAKLRALIHENGTIYVTLIGDEDDWAEYPDLHAVSFDAAKAAISELGFVALHQSVYWERGPTYSGELKNWHTFAFVLVAREPTEKL